MVFEFLRERICQPGRYAGFLQFTDVNVDEAAVQVCNRGQQQSQLQCKRECRDLTAGQHIRVACCGFFEETSTAGLLGALGWTALGVGGAGALGAGIAAAAGAFNGWPPPAVNASK